MHIKKYSLKVKKEIEKGLPGFDAQKRMSPSIRTDLLGNNLPNNNTRQSAVLILLFNENNRISTLFIKRTTYNGPHSGQISFPGGKCDENDKTIQETALRETEEEIGITPSEIEILGTLTPLYIPVSNMMVHPFVGYSESKPLFQPNNQEVEYIIVTPLEDLLNPSSKSIKVIHSHGRPITAPYYSIDEEMIWGATAMILSEFLVIAQKVCPFNATQ